MFAGADVLPLSNAELFVRPRKGQENKVSKIKDLQGMHILGKNNTVSNYKYLLAFGGQPHWMYSIWCIWSLSRMFVFEMFDMNTQSVQLDIWRANVAIKKMNPLLGDHIGFQSPKVAHLNRENTSAICVICTSLVFFQKWMVGLPSIQTEQSTKDFLTAASTSLAVAPFTVKDRFPMPLTLVCGEPKCV